LYGCKSGCREAVGTVRNGRFHAGVSINWTNAAAETPGPEGVVETTGILRQFPAPLAAWKTYSILGCLQAKLGRQDAAHAAFSEAASIISYIAGNISDEGLRKIFLQSAAVQKVTLPAQITSRLD
jgi:hypothetical protein